MLTGTFYYWGINFHARIPLTWIRLSGIVSISGNIYKLLYRRFLSFPEPMLCNGFYKIFRQIFLSSGRKNNTRQFFFIAEVFSHTCFLYQKFSIVFKSNRHTIFIGLRNKIDGILFLGKGGDGFRSPRYIHRIIQNRR